MKKSMIAAFALALVGGTSAALAQPGPDIGKPFGDPNFRGAPPAVAAAPGPVTSGAEATARLQADGYRAINLVRGTDGGWHGTAIRGSAKVNVHVAQDGRVLTR
jgi:hypothetical protein